jgi:hypothetical protein
MQKLTPARIPTPYKASARHYCLHKGKSTPDLVTVKGFLRFYIAISRGKIVEKPTADSVNTRNGSSTEDIHFQRVDDKSAGSASGGPKLTLKGLLPFRDFKSGISGSLFQILVS